jgi:hypothetical protein
VEHDLPGRVEPLAWKGVELRPAAPSPWGAPLLLARPIERVAFLSRIDGFGVAYVDPDRKFHDHRPDPAPIATIASGRRCRIRAVVMELTHDYAQFFPRTAATSAIPTATTGGG